MSWLVSIYMQVNENNELIGQLTTLDVKNSDKTVLTVAGLQPDTHYQFQLAAYTRKGDGERSQARRVKTKGAGRHWFITNIVHF